MASHILVIDAHRKVLAHYQRILQAEGYGVETTTYKTETWAEIERASPDLIIFDFLADADSEQQAWQLAQQLRLSVLTASIPILICTAGFVFLPFSHFVQQTHIPVLFKPLDVTELIRTVHSMLPVC